MNKIKLLTVLYPIHENRSLQGNFSHCNMSQVARMESILRRHVCQRKSLPQGQLKLSYGREHYSMPTGKDTVCIFKLPHLGWGNAQWLGPLAVLAENPGLVPSTHVAASDHLYFQFQRI